MTTTTTKNTQPRPRPEMMLLGLAWLVVFILMVVWGNKGTSMSSLLGMSGNRPLLVATVGMKYQDVKAKSTLNLGEGFYDGGDEYALRDHKFIGEQSVFDWQMPGSKLVFPGCRYYWLQTEKNDDPRLMFIRITVAQEKLTWQELGRQIKDLRTRLREDGWKPVRYKEGKTSDQYLGEIVDKPDLKNWNNELGGVSYGKGDVALTVSAKRLGEVAEDQDPLAGAAFIYWIELQTRKEWERLRADAGAAGEEPLPR